MKNGLRFKAVIAVPLGVCLYILISTGAEALRQYAVRSLISPDIQQTR